uniref:hypothetical protein n=1 Tax=Herbidospora sakaeratensis TaxID=564415 RepID=UPI000785256B|nr:hypothetical protein [Herbidospora sakaeratensis]
MLKTRARFAVRGAGAGAAAALLLLGLPALAGNSDGTTTYSCVKGAETSSTPYQVRVILGGPDQPTPSAPVSVLWSLLPATPTASGGPVLSLPTPLAVGDQVAAFGVLRATGPAIDGSTPTPTPTPSQTPSTTPSGSGSQTPSQTPSTTPSSTPSQTPSRTPSTTPSQTASRTPSTTPSQDPDESGDDPVYAGATANATVTVATPVTQGATVWPIPPLVGVVTPEATGVFEVSAREFTVRVKPSGASTESVLYNCSLPDTATPVALKITVVASPTPTSSTTPSSTPTPTPTGSGTPTPRGTVTATATVTAPTPVDRSTRTATATVTAQVETPDGGVATGGGGSLGPDGRVLVLAGGTVTLAAMVGGLMLRRRVVS